jgi:hypothetical protein
MPLTESERENALLFVFQMYLSNYAESQALMFIFFAEANPLLQS